MLEPFLVRALAAALGLAIVAAPLGCVVVWQRLSYFGETVAQAGLIGVALALLLHMDLTFVVVLTALAVAGLIILFGQQKLLALDSILGLLHHAALALGVIATALLRGPSVDLMGFLFGDVFAVSGSDLVWIFAGGAGVLVAMALLWQPLVQLAVNEELAAAEGVNVERTRSLFTILLAVTIAIAMKIVGVLLVMAFLIVPAVAARPFSATPERMVVLAVLVAILGVAGGLTASLTWDVPGGPAIVLAMAFLAAISLAIANIRAVRSA